MSTPTERTPPDDRHPPSIRVLFLVDHLLENGGLRITVDLVRRLRSVGVEADLFVLQQVAGEPTLQPEPGLPVSYATRRPRALRFALPAGLRRLIRSAGRYDLIVCGSEVGYSLLLGRLAARWRRRPFVVLVQAPVEGAIQQWVPGPLHELTRRAHATADATVCVSAGLVQDVLDTGQRRDRVHVITIGVDVDGVRRLGLQPAQPPPPAGPYVVAVGRLTEQKGFDLLLRAHAQVVVRGWPHRLLIVGEGPDRAELEALATRLGVSASVQLTGFVANPQPLIAGSDLFVLSSRREGSGGLVLVEALSHAVPVVATDCRYGPRVVLDGGRFGRLVPVGDVDALADAIADHLSDPDPLRTSALGGPGRAREFDPSTTAAGFARIANQLVGAHA